MIGLIMKHSRFCLTQDKGFFNSDFELENEIKITFEWMQNFQRSMEAILKEKSQGLCKQVHVHATS